MNFKVVILGAVLGLAVSPALGQKGTKPGQKPKPATAAPAKAPTVTIFQTGPFDRLSLLRNKKVQAELKLTKQQIAGLSGAGGGRVIPEPGDNRKIINKTLTIAQQIRFQQIVLQQEGIMVATIGEVAKVLGLTKSQLDRIYKIQGEANEKNMEIATMDISEAEMKSRAAKINATVEPAVFGVLTSAQRAKWREMLGKPLALS